MDGELEQSLKNLRQNLGVLAEEFQSNMQSLSSITHSVNESLENLRTAYAPAIKEFSERVAPLIQGLAYQAKQWQEERKVSVSLLANEGWFPNWYTFQYHPTKEIASDNELMISQIDFYWDEIKAKIIELSPNRKHILEVAFDLHEKKNHVASIPLILAQSDGICSEEYSHFFSKDSVTGRRASDEIIHQADTDILKLNFFSVVLLEPFKVNLQLSNSSSRSSRAAKAKGPNRHGIIHGSGKHLDYGTEINGYKAVSFLAFIVYTAKDEFKKT